MDRILCEGGFFDYAKLFLEQLRRERWENLSSIVDVLYKSTHLLKLHKYIAIGNFLVFSRNQLIRV